MSCKTCREPNDPHWPAYHSCIAALEKRMADRIAKLEDVARRFEHMVEWQTAKVASEVEWERRVAKLEARAAPPDWTEQPDGMPIEPADKQTRANAMLEAARDYLAQDKSLDELMPSPWQVEPPAAAGPIPPGYALAPGWTTDGIEDDDTCTRDARCPDHPRYRYRHGSEPRACAAHAVEMGALVKAEPPAEQPAGAADELPGYETTDGCIFCRKRVQDPDEEKCLHCRPAPAQGAPAEPLKPWPTNRLAWCCWCDRRDIPSATAKDHWQQCEEHPANERIAALEARLAAAETEKAMLSAHCVRAERVAQERKEALAVAERERDCGQDGVCAISPGCARHWQERNRELVRERDEAKESAKAAWQQRDYAVAISDAMRCERDDAKEALVSVKQAVAAERERCIRAACAELFKFKMAHRHDQFDEADIAEAIRDGRQAK